MAALHGPLYKVSFHPLPPTPLRKLNDSKVNVMKTNIKPRTWGKHTDQGMAEFNSATGKTGNTAMAFLAPLIQRYPWDISILFVALLYSRQGKMHLPV